MKLGDSICTGRLNSHSSFLNVGPFWCMFTQRDPSAADFIADWVNRATEAAGQVHHLRDSQADKPLRLAAFEDTFTHFSSPLGRLQIPHGGPLFSKERRLRSTEWDGFVEAMRMGLRECATLTDLDVSAESGHGGLANEYPWKSWLEYHSNGTHAVSAEVWFTSEPELYFMRQFFIGVDARIRGAMSDCDGVGDTPGIREVLDELRLLALC